MKKKRYKCQYCNGKGYTGSFLGITCSKCRGTGKSQLFFCILCSGEKPFNTVHDVLFVEGVYKTIAQAEKRVKHLFPNGHYKICGFYFGENIK